MDLSTYVAQLPAEQRASLYDSHWTCQALLRSLPPVAQQYILRFSFLDGPVDRSCLSSWIQPQFRSTHDAALATLLSLRVLEVSRTEGGAEGLQLQPAFQRNLRCGLHVRSWQAPARHMHCCRCLLALSQRLRPRGLVHDPC